MPLRAILAIERLKVIQLYNDRSHLMLKENKCGTGTARCRRKFSEFVIFHWIWSTFLAIQGSGPIPPPEFFQSPLLSRSPLNPWIGANPPPTFGNPKSSNPPPLLSGGGGWSYGKTSLLTYSEHWQARPLSIPCQGRKGKNEIPTVYTVHAIQYILHMYFSSHSIQVNVHVQNNNET